MVINLGFVILVMAALTLFVSFARLAQNIWREDWVLATADVVLVVVMLAVISIAAQLQ